MSCMQPKHREAPETRALEKLQQLKDLIAPETKEPRQIQQPNDKTAPEDRRIKAISAARATEQKERLKAI